MTRKITFSTPDDKELTITLKDNELYFCTGYSEAGPFTTAESIDIKDVLEQMIDTMN